MKKISLLIAFTITILCVSAAPKYWIGGASGNWATITNWSSTTGGTADQSAAPATGDDVYFDANSGSAVTVYCTGALATLNSLNATSCNVTFAIVPAVTYTVASGVITTASKTINLANTTGIATAQFVYVQSGDGAIPFATTVSSIVANTSVTLSLNPTVGNASNPATLAFVPTTATSITTKTVTLDNANVKAFFNVTVNGNVGNGTSTYDFSFLNNSTWTQCPLANGQAITLGSAANTFYITGNSPTNYFDGNTNGYIAINSTTNQTLYFNQSTIAANGGIGGSPVTAPTVPGWGALSPTKGIMTIGNSVGTNRIVFGTNSGNVSQGIILSPNVTLNITGNGSCTFNATTNCQGIDASASGVKLIVSSQNSTIITTTSGNKIFKPSTVVNYLEYNKSTFTFTLPQAITVNNLVLSNGTISNTTNNITLSNGATITRNAGTLSAVPTFGTSTNVIYSNTAAITSGNELPTSVVSLTLNGTQAITLAAPLTISGSLTLTSGTLTNSATNNVTFNSGGATPVEIIRTAGTIGGTGSTYPAFTSQVNLTFNNTSATTTSYEVPLDVLKLNNLTINNSAGVVLSADRSINGSLNLISGILTIGTIATPRTLTMKGNSVIRTSGSIDASISGSGVNFTNTSALTLPAGLFNTNVNNLIINGAGGITLNSTLTVNAMLTLTNGKVSLGNNDLILGTSISGGSTSSYIITDGLGKLTLPVTATTDVQIPIGVSVSSYDPVTLNAATATTFAAKVASIGNLNDKAVYGIRYNPIQWTLTPAVGSNTTVSLTPSTLDAKVSASPVIGIYNSGSDDFNNYNSPVVSLSGGIYSGSFDLSLTPTPLVIITGSNVDVTGIGQTVNEIKLCAKNGILQMNGISINDVVRLYNLSGALLKNYCVNSNLPEVQLNKGIYIVKISSKNKETVSKLIVD